MRHSLSSLAEAEIEALEADGIRLTAHEVIHICALADLIETPASRIGLARGRPVPVGGTFLWPITLAAEEWWEQVGQHLGSIKIQKLALGYAMAKGNQLLPYDMTKAREAVDEWKTRLTASLPELETAIAVVQEQDESIDTGETVTQKSTHGDLSVLLAAVTKSDPAIWEYQCSIGYVIDMLELIVAQNEADGKASTFDARLRAERALGLCIHRIRKRHEAEHDSGDKDS